MWQPSVLETYGEEKPDYLSKRSGPLREKYPNSMGDRELITSLTKVKIIIDQLINAFDSNLGVCVSIGCTKKSFIFQDDLFYNAYETDIAVVNICFGDSTVFGKMYENCMAAEYF